MKVKVRGRIYDAQDEPLMVILNPFEKKQIAELHPDITKYCQCPADALSEEDIREWMKTDDDLPDEIVEKVEAQDG